MMPPQDGIDRSVAAPWWQYERPHGEQYGLRGVRCSEHHYSESTDDAAVCEAPRAWLVGRDCDVCGVAA